MAKLKNINCSIINMHTIKPIDSKKIKEISQNHKLIVTVEEHNILGGLGTAVAEVLAEKYNNCKLIKIGINDFYSAGGSYQYLQKTYGLSVKKIIETILQNYKLK